MNEHQSTISENQIAIKKYFIVKNARTFTNICSHYQPASTTKYHKISRFEFHEQNVNF